MCKRIFSYLPFLINRGTSYPPPCLVSKKGMPFVGATVTTVCRQTPLTCPQTSPHYVPCLQLRCDSCVRIGGYFWLCGVVAAQDSTPPYSHLWQCPWHCAIGHLIRQPFRVPKPPHTRRLRGQGERVAYYDRLYRSVDYKWSRAVVEGERVRHTRA